MQEKKKCADQDRESIPINKDKAAVMAVTEEEAEIKTVRRMQQLN